MGRPVGLLAGVAVIAGVAAGVWALACGVLVLATARLTGWRPGYRFAGALLLCLLLGSARHPDGSAGANGDIFIGTSRALGVVDSLPLARQAGERVVLRIEQVWREEGWRPAAGRVVAYMPGGAPAYTVGDRVDVTWTVTPANAAAPGIRSFVLSQEANASAQVWTLRVVEQGHAWQRYLVAARRSISTRLQLVAPGDAGALMAGIVTGDDSGLSDPARAAFRATGTGHITAVSGANVALLLALWNKVPLRRARRRHLLAQGAIIASIWLYCGITGLEPSALRAVTVATLIIVSQHVGRDADPMTILVLAAAGLLLWQPAMVWSVGFWLSVVASAALIGTFAMPAARSRPGNVRAMVLGLVAVQFATLPVQVWVFGGWSPVGLVANLVVAPVVTAAFPLTFLFVPLAYLPHIGGALAVVPTVPCDIALGVIGRLAPVLPPVSFAPLGFAGVLVLALPCLAVVLAVNVDMRRWWPRWHTLAATRPGLASAMCGGALAGVAIVALARVWPGW